MSRTRFIFASATLAILACAFAACGGGGNADASPESVLEGATFNGIESADVEGKLKVVSSGKEGGDVEVGVEGPFETVEGGTLPKLDMTATAKGTAKGRKIDFEGGLTLLPSSAYVNYKGTEYEVDPTSFSFVESALKEAEKEGEGEGETAGAKACQDVVGELHVSDFVDNLSNEGESEAGGSSATKISGDLDVPGAIDALLKVYEDPACSSQLSGAAGQLPSAAELRKAKSEVADAIDSARVDVYVGDDDIVRRIDAKLDLTPSGKGSENATVDFDLTLAGVNEDQNISPPAQAKPLNLLFEKLGVNPLELIGALQGQGPGLENLFEGIGREALGGSGGKGEAGYLKCLKKAQSTTELQKCVTQL